MSKVDAQLANGGAIRDANKVPLVSFPATVASAVNYVEIANSATGNPVKFTATGTDTNIAVVIIPKGTYGVGIGSYNTSLTHLLQVNGPIGGNAFSGTYLDVSGGNAILQGNSSVLFNTGGSILRFKISSTGIYLPSASSIADINGNALISFPSTVASAVNYLKISNAATGNAPTIEATGADANINIYLNPKGSGSVVLPNGSVSNPSFVFASDTNTGIYRGGAGLITFVCSGSIRGSFTTSGLSLAEGANLLFGTTTGTKLGTATNQKIGAYGNTPVVQPTVSGSRGGNAALQSLLTALALIGWISDTTTA